MLLKRDIDVLNFDAYNFTKEFLLYHSDIKSFTSRGGTIAWGMVPTSDAIDNQTRKSLVERCEEAVKMLADKGIDKDLISSLVTPSCGVGALDETRAAKVMEMTAALSARLIKNG